MSSYDISLSDMETEHRPLSSAALHILLALAESNLHGYGIMQAVKRQSGGQYKLGPGTLYSNLDRLLANGWVGEIERHLKHGDTRRETSRRRLEARVKRRRRAR